MSSPRNQQFDYDYQNFDINLDNYELKEQLDMNLAASMNMNIANAGGNHIPNSSGMQSVAEHGAAANGSMGPAYNPAFVQDLGQSQSRPLGNRESTETGLATRTTDHETNTSSTGNDSSNDGLNPNLMSFGEFSNYYDTDYSENSKFQGSKNVFLADNMNLTKHQSHLSISSNQEFFSKSKMPNSNSIDSIPPLTSSVSNQSLLESPNSFKKPSSNANSQSFPPSQQAKVLNSSSQSSTQPQIDINPSSNPPHLMTPRKLTRNKSFSMGSYNLSTPLKSNPSPTASNSNPNSANNKISKTPYRHSRSLSRSRLDKSTNMNLNPFYTPISNQASSHSRNHSLSQSNTHSSSGYNNTSLQNSTNSNISNSAISNSFISPKYNDGLSFDNDDFRTPLQASDLTHTNPHYSLPNYSSPQYFLNNAHPPLVPHHQHQNSGQEQESPQPTLPGLQSLSSFQAQSAQPNYKFSPSLRRQNTLDSIKIEDQDDDAFKQLKRAKSFNNFRPLSENGLHAGGPDHIDVAGSNTVGNSPQFYSNPYDKAASQPTSSTQLQLIGKLSGLDQEIEEGDKSNLGSKSLNNIELIQSQFNNLKSYPATVNLASIAGSNDNINSGKVPNEMNQSYFQPINGLLPPMTSFGNNSLGFQSNSAPATASGSSFNHSPVSAPQLNLASVAGAKSASGSETSASTSTPNSFPAASQQPNLTEIANSNKTPRNASSKHVKVSESNLQIAKEINPEFVPDLPIKINEKAADLSDPKKKHACPLCLARFQRPEHVKRHMKSHSLEKPFECNQPNCGKRFNRKDNLKAHLKKIHSLI